MPAANPTTRAHAGPGPLAGRRILLVEDNFLVGTAIRRILEGLGCRVLGPFGSAEPAAHSAATDDYDVAVLDVAIHGGTSAAVATAARARGRPVVFVTGFSSGEMLPEELRGLPRLVKPVDPAALELAIAAAL